MEIKIYFDNDTSSLANKFISICKDKKFNCKKQSITESKYKDDYVKYDGNPDIGKVVPLVCIINETGEEQCQIITKTSQFKKIFS